MSVRAAVSAACGLSVPSCLRLVRLLTVRFLNLERLYPGGGKQWSAPTPTLLWRCCVDPVSLLGRPRSVSSVSDVYTQKVRNNGRHQLLPSCGVAPPVRLMHSLSMHAVASSECNLRMRTAASTVSACCCIGHACVRACMLLPVSSVVCACVCVLLHHPCVRSSASVVRAASAMRVWVHAASAVRGLFVPPCPWARLPMIRFLSLGRLYTGSGKQWSAPTPTMLWRGAVDLVDRLRCPRSVSSISNFYTQEVGNNSRHQPLPCCGFAMSVRSVHGLSMLVAASYVARAYCYVSPVRSIVRACVRAATSAL
ncbi:hypothetical protein AAC387_Pa12g0290 [Persea americana]